MMPHQQLFQDEKGDKTDYEPDIKGKVIFHETHRGRQHMKQGAADQCPCCERHHGQEEPFKRGFLQNKRQATDHGDGTHQ